MEMAIFRSGRSRRSLPMGVSVDGTSSSSSSGTNKKTERIVKTPLHWKDLKILGPLGTGTFCDVLEVDNGGRLCALKRLRRNASDSDSSFVENSSDLASEAAILTNLEHPNIIRVHGMAEGPIEDAPVANEEGFFVVMERLEETLLDRIKRWKVQPNPHDRRALYDRLDVALELAKAVRYLHGQKVVHRDLKSDNIGFDDTGTLKLFDFGLAAKITPRGLTGIAGTRCYMAPEMAMQQRYGTKVDVYAFGLLLWEICSLEQAFEGYNEKRHFTRVVRNAERPRIRWGWPRALQHLVRTCWSPEPQERPTMDHVVETLERILEHHHHKTTTTTMTPTKQEEEEEEKVEDDPQQQQQQQQQE